MTYTELRAWAMKQPPMTKEELLLQSVDFAYGQLACTRNHKPCRAAFESIALTRGMTLEQFEAWALTKEWTR